jgi:anti-sigma regulatory factor (Ser/Thr protein kinase)
MQPTPEAPARARGRLMRLAEGLPQRAQDDAVLLTSELVTNAVVHGSGIITVAIERDDEAIAVAVGDYGDAQPVAALHSVLSDETAAEQTTPDAQAEGGRGLHLVRALATCWGVRRSRDGVGKVVWFRLA